ncbi:MAG: hypothetical protein KF860_00185 [Cyclobacteriaceae bacterium]|nr:hypothetical protein [Cyclobacteriaceae bacterium]
MEKISQGIDDLLVAYLEGSLNGDKLEKVKNRLNGSEELRHRLEVLKLIQQSLESNTLLHPSDNFTQHVMGNLHKAPTVSLLSPKNGLILLTGILIAMGIGASLVNTGVFDTLNGMLPLNQIKLPSGISTPALPSIPLSGKLIVNSIIALNIGLAFLLLDRTILKPLFNKRARMHV